MNLYIRPPLPHEWRICRMLLPETFADHAAREYLLCRRDEAPHIVGAASYRRVGDRITHLRVHVVSSFRRQHVGSDIIAHIVRSGAESLEGTAEIAADPGLQAFCDHNRFARVDGLTTVEAGIADIRDYMRHLRDRITPPPSAHLIPLSSAPADQVTRLHTQYVVHAEDLSPWRFLIANTPGLSHSPVLMVDGKVAGLLLWELVAGVAVIRSRVVTPELQGRWANTMLLAEGLDTAWNIGVRRVQFGYNDANRDTKKMAARLKSHTLSVMAQLIRRRTT